MNKCFILIFIIFTLITFIVSMYLFHNVSIPAIVKFIEQKTKLELDRLEQLKVVIFVISVVHLLCFLGIFFNLAYNIFLMKSILVPVYVLLAIAYIYISVNGSKSSNESDNDRKTESAINLFFALFVIDLFLHIIFIYSVKRNKIKKYYKPLKPFDILKIFNLKKLLLER